MDKQLIVEECKKCLKHDGAYCTVYPDPAWHWRNNQRCAARLYAQVEDGKTAKKKKMVSQPKQTKKARLTAKQQRAYTRIGGK